MVKHTPGADIDQGSLVEHCVGTVDSVKNKVLNKVQKSRFPYVHPPLCRDGPFS